MKWVWAMLLVCRTVAADVKQVEQLLDDWQLEDAMTIAREMLANDPENPEAWMAAALVQHQRGEHLSALALLEASEDAGHDPGYIKSMVESSARLAAHTESVESPHFSIRYVNKDEVVAHYAAGILEKAYVNIAGDLAFLPAERGEKIVVEILPSARDLAGATGLTLNEIETSGTIAVCKFHRLMIISPLATINGYDWGDTLAHEFVHLVISKKSSNTIPIWLHEGIAKFYESRWKGKAGQALSPYGEKLLKQATETGKFITFEQMHPSMAKLPSQDDAALAFAEVFSVIEFLHGKHGKKSIASVLETTARGVDLEQALRDVFGMSLGGIERAWKKYLTGRKFRDVPGAAPRPIRLASSEQEAKEERPLEHIEDKESHNFSRLGELLQLRGHHHAAVVEYEKAYKRSGVRYATLINRLARAYIEIKQPGKAVEVLGALLSAHPTDGDAHLLAGRVALAMDNQQVGKKHFEAVRMQNPFNPEVHHALATIYEKLGDKDAAGTARRFFELTRKPRSTSTFELPTPKAGNAHISIITHDWSKVRVNGALPIATPAWRLPVDAGEVTIEVAGELKSIEVAKGEAKTVIF